MAKLKPCSKITPCRRAKKRSHDREANKKINASYQHMIYLNMHLIKDRSDTTVGKRSRKQNFRPTNQEPKIIQEDCIQGFRSWLTNRCRGSRVVEDRRCRSPQLGISMTSQPRGYRSLEPSRDLVQRASPTNKILEEGSKARPLH